MLFTLAVIFAVIVTALLIKYLSREDDREQSEEEREITFSQHAILRMNERDIDPERILRVLEEGRKVEITNYNRMKIMDDEITVILEKKLANFEVITIYWNSGDRETPPFDD